MYPTCTVFLVRQQFVPSPTLTFHPIGTQEINIALEETFSKYAILGMLNAGLRTSTVVVAAHFRVLCCKYKTKPE